MIELARDFWFKNTLNCLKDDSKYILEIVETLSTSMALLLFLLILEKNENIQPPMLREVSSLRQIRKEYLTPLVYTMQAGMEGLLEDIKKQPMATEALEHRKIQLYAL